MRHPHTMDPGKGFINKIIFRFQLLTGIIVLDWCRCAPNGLHIPPRAHEMTQ